MKVPVTIGGRQYAFSKEDVTQAMEGIVAERIFKHFIRLEDGREVAVKQVIGELTGLARREYTSKQSCRALRRIGYDPT